MPRPPTQPTPITPPAKPRISIAATSTDSVEEGEAAGFTLTSNKTLSGTINVKVRVSDSPSGAYYSGPATVTIPMTDRTETFTVATVEDTVDEVNGSVSATVQSGTGYMPVPGTATVTVLDDDEPTVTIAWHSDTPADRTITEGAEVRFVLTADREPVADTDVVLEFMGGSAFITNTLPPHVTISGGTMTATFRLFTGDDNKDELNSDLSVRVVDGDGYPVGGESVATLTIMDNDRPAVPTGLIANGDLQNGKIRLRWLPAPGDNVTYEVQHLLEECTAGSCLAETTPRPDDPTMYRVNWRTATVVSTTTVTVVDEDGNDVDMVEAEVSGIGELTDAASLWRLRIRSKIVDPSFWTTDYVYTYPTDALFTGELDQQVGPAYLNSFQTNGLFEYKVCNQATDPADAKYGHYPIRGGLTVMDVTNAIGLWDSAVKWAKANGDNIVRTTGTGTNACYDPKDTRPYNQVSFHSQKYTRNLCNSEIAVACWSSSGSHDRAFVFGALIIDESHDWGDPVPGATCKRLHATLAHEAGHALGIGGFPHADIPQSIMAEPTKRVGVCGPTYYDVALVMTTYQSRGR